MEMEVLSVDKDTSITVLGVRVDIQAPDSEFQVERRALKAEMIPNLQASKLITKIDGNADAEVAVQAGRMMQAGINKAREFFKPKKQAIDKVKDVVLDAEREDVAEYEREKTRLTDLLLAYTREEKRKAAEQQRLEEEKRKKDEDDRKLAEAQYLQEQGAPAEVVEAKLVEETMPQAIVHPTAPKFAGSTQRKAWVATVFDQKALVEAIAAGKVPMQAFEWNQSFLNNQATQFRDGLNYPGVSTAPKDSMSFRGK